VANLEKDRYATALLDALAQKDAWLAQQRGGHD
jgi:hypothetical protein